MATEEKIRRETTEHRESMEPNEMRNISTEPRLTREERRVAERPRFNETWKPVTGGLLAIIAGSLNFLAGLGIVLGATIIADLLAGLPAFGAGIGVGTALMVVGALSVVGGAFAVRRQVWPLALIGSIAALFPSPTAVLGVLSLIWVTLSRYEFRRY